MLTPLVNDAYQNLSNTSTQVAELDPGCVSAGGTVMHQPRETQNTSLIRRLSEGNKRANTVRFVQREAVILPAPVVSIVDQALSSILPVPSKAG